MKELISIFDFIIYINIIFFIQAGLLINLIGISGQGICGASLVSANRLVTAAHCWFDGQDQATKFTVVLGTTNFLLSGTRIETTSVFTHGSWNPSLAKNDIAMIHLPSNVVTSGESLTFYRPTYKQNLN
jgi:secreted trypsin-like serine protease